MTNTSLNATDFHLLHYFAVVAEENNLRRAAERLFMAQPPLSRHIKRLEERLGLTLFIRHTKGLTLTEEGARVLESIRPLLRLQAETFQQLDALAKPLEKVFALGFTTAFEQGIFSAMEAHLRERHGKSLRVTRNSSPKLVRDVRKRRLDAALVALPLDAPGLASPLCTKQSRWHAGSYNALEWRKSPISKFPTDTLQRTALSFCKPTKPADLFSRLCILGSGFEGEHGTRHANHFL